MKIKSSNLTKISALVFVSLFLFSFSFAEIVHINLLDRGGKIVQEAEFNTSVGTGGRQANERMRILWFCLSKKLLNDLTCDYTLSVSGKEMQPNVSLDNQVQFQTPSNPVVDTPSSATFPGSTPAQQVVYQVIERAVPGPQGPAGRDGVDHSRASSNNSEFLSQYASSPSYSAQYNGFGSGNSTNPTGDAALSTISGAGLASCNSATSKVVYNASSKMFECGTDQSGGVSVMPENATFTLATITKATSTNFYSGILTALTSYITNLLFTNATGTSATTTNFFSSNLNSTNASSSNILGTLATITSGTSTNWFVDNLGANNSSTTNASTSNLIATNATFSYATVTNGFFTNLSVTGPVSAALTNGFVFRGGASNFSEATSTIFVANSGFVGIGSTTPSEKLSVEGNLLVSGNIVSPKMSNLPVASNGNDIMLCRHQTTGVVSVDSSGSCWTFMTSTFSDINLKKNIVALTSTLEKVKSLNTVNFNWIDESRGTTTQLGYIAQDVEKVFPEVIVKDSNGFLKVNYISLSAIYTNAIKELDVLVNKNTEKILEILNKLTKTEEEILLLKSRVQVLESRLNIPTPPQEPTILPAIIPVETETATETVLPQTPETDTSNTSVSSQDPAQPPLETPALPNSTETTN